MRRVLTVLLVMSLCLLAACVGRENAPLPRETLTLPPEEKELPAYQFQTLSAQEQFFNRRRHRTVPVYLSAFDHGGDERRRPLAGDEKNRRRRRWRPLTPGCRN